MYQLNLIILKTLLSLLTLLLSFSLLAQFQQEEIRFESANPFSLSDVIVHLDELETQSVYGQLTLHVDSLNPQKSIL